MKSIIPTLTATAFLLFSLPLHSATVRVTTTLQAAVDLAQSGDTILIPPGVYREGVRIAKDNLSLRGSPGAVLDGTGLPSNIGIRVAPSSPTGRLEGFTLSGLQIQNFAQTGVLLSRVDNFTISHGRYFGNRLYGIFPVRSAHGRIELNQVAASEDAGIYVGQSSDVVVAANRTKDCRVGIEIENSTNVGIDRNRASGNSIGILVSVLPLLSTKITSDIRVTHNVLEWNNRLLPPDDPENPFDQLPNGIGLLNLGGDRLVAEQNLATHNDSAGIAIARLPAELAMLDPLVDPLPDHNEVRDNVTLQNGDQPHPLLDPLPGSDLLWDGTGTDNRWCGNVNRTAFPVLPDC